MLKNTSNIKISGGNFMKKVSKSILTVMIIAMLVFTTSIALADSSTSVQPQKTNEKQEQVLKEKEFKIKDKKIKVKVKDEAVGKVSSQDIEEIANQAIEIHPELTEYNINIENVTEQPLVNNLESTERTVDESLENYHWYDTGSYYSTTKSPQSSNNPTSAKFVTSVAKGETKKLGYKFSMSVSSTYSASGSMPSGAGASVSGSLTSTQTKEYTAESTWSGPAESSGYLSREYYETGYRTYGKFSVYQFGYWSDHHHNTYTGDYWDAQSRFTSWSMDIK
jgi:hypothetical protein